MTDKLNPREELVTLIPSMRAFARSLTRDHSAADDLVQDTIVKAWTNFDKFKEGTNLRAWLFIILRNTFYSNMRKGKREVQDVDGVFSGKLMQKPSQDSAMEFNDFKKAFSTLPDDQREALILVGASGFSYEEAARICDCAVGTMKSRVNRGRTKLAQIMEMSAEEIGAADASTLAVLSASTLS
ncbi:RNA polymerase sigma factor [Oceanicella sp. SM1341]|uniref:RNA polymerase sigma factor n=1 Tax=Oceanicella sp. SM1341 TaxID=1548889 RepID=UPI000E47D6B1|nr:RNA polymerase sigma factor [Oceanicella sp. SM1341]